jgi:hypothetical protein
MHKVYIPASLTDTNKPVMINKIIIMANGGCNETETDEDGENEKEKDEEYNDRIRKIIEGTVAITTPTKTTI